jgi:hypothetical protein
MHVRWAAALACALAVALIANRALGWQEFQQRGDDTHIVVDSTGVASVRHELHFHVVRGPLTRIDLVNVAPSAEIDPVVSIAADGGRMFQARAARRDERTVRIAVSDPHVLVRGDVTFDVGWRIDLTATGSLSRDSSGWRLTLSGPAAHDGFDGARTVLELPAAPNEPRPVVAETGVVDDSAVATLRREPERDVLGLFRPHVARGETPTLAVRLDARALTVAADPPAYAKTKPTPSPDPRGVALGGAAATLGIGLFLLVAHKSRAFAAACTAHGALARGLLPLPERARATLAGVGLAVGVWLEIRGQTGAGAACVSIAVLAAALRASGGVPRVRGPGHWRVLRPEESFHATARGHWLDIDSDLGRAVGIVAAAVAAIAFVALRRFDTESAWLEAMDAAVVLPLLLTGRASQLPPKGTDATARWLARPFQRLRAIADLDVALLARVSAGGDIADELRVQVVPQMGIKGVVGLEVGLVWSATAVGWTKTPEVLARVTEGSAAAIKLARDIPRTRSTPGRRLDERVVRLRPRNPTPSGTVALVRRLAAALTERRSAPSGGGAWTGPEQRKDPSGLDQACLVPPCRL